MSGALGTLYTNNILSNVTLIMRKKPWKTLQKNTSPLTENFFLIAKKYTQDYSYENLGKKRNSCDEFLQEPFRHILLSGSRVTEGKLFSMPANETHGQDILRIFSLFNG